MLEQIDHVNLVVDDLEAMIAFYRDVLGLRVTKEVAISGQWVETVVGLKNVRADVVYLDAPTGPRIELIRYRSPEGTRPNGLGAGNTKGLRHFAFRVTDITATVAKLKQAGVRFESDVEQVPDSQVTYAGGARKRIVYFYDPEGNLLELCEYR
jgi:catechol 2,3-dioxygenase-like lactoylglutathione lyase family enzyme